MYFKIIVVFVVLAIISVNSAPIDQLAATILKYEYEPNANNDGGYRLEYETSDGQTRSEVGTIKYVGEENLPVLTVNGAYSYVGPDGVTYTVTYLADENGFSPHGDHLPGNAGDSSSGPQLRPQELPLALPENAIKSLVG